MLDANGDINHPKMPDRGMQEFIQKTNLIDAYHQKFHDSPRTYMWGTKRLNYILVDPALTQAIEQIGYLGTHEGAETDHVYAYMDLKDKVANQGFIHRPITTKSRDFLLAQSDKVKIFLTNWYHWPNARILNPGYLNWPDPFQNTGQPKTT